MNLKESLKLAQEYDLSFEYNDFFSVAVLDDKSLQEQIIRQYKQERKDCSKDTVHGAFLDVTLHSTDPQIQKISQLRVRQSMEIASRMEVRAVIFHSGLLMRFHEPGYIKNWCDANEEFYRQMLEEYPQLHIYVENMFDDKPDMLLKLANRMKDSNRFGICLDYAHELLYDISGLEWMEYMAPYIHHIHINDNQGMEDEHLPVGQGKNHWNHFKELYDRYTPDSSVLIEVTGIQRQRESLEYMKQAGILCKDNSKG